MRLLDISSGLEPIKLQIHSKRRGANILQIEWIEGGVPRERFPTACIRRGASVVKALNPWADGRGICEVRRPWTGAVGKSAPMDGGYLPHGTNTPAVGLFCEIERLDAYLTDSGKQQAASSPCSRLRHEGTMFPLVLPVDHGKTVTSCVGFDLVREGPDIGAVPDGK